ncbi:metal ABC transporter ATP-binding protein [Halomicroarcula limicola]|uniref:Cobalamin import ATP-binding protein BtuD n=1 Tax=Haloarcula limicola TaxID=1429915 RepID=A0A8J7YGX8_9EURY|nr:metal ABC transporter ATP-binding protein [Halomicroarcula limicola]MBV0926273.1 metal ABC transporter ATP-binding protein [Halomicroarcula limicola]
MSTQDTDSVTAADTDERATTETDTDTPSSNPVVDLTDVTFGYTATPVVEDISLEIYPGEYVAIVGPNGSGKSTLMQLMLGLLEPDTGTAHLFGEHANRFDDGERIGYVAQQANAAKEMPITVREVVKMGRFPHIGFGRLSSEDWTIVDDALTTVGMSAFADRRVTQLSGGQRQRAFIARALASEAELLVLDEPTVGVDAESVDAFYELLATLNAEGITVLLIEHDLGAIVEHADRAVCLNREVYFDGPTGEFVDSDALARAFGTEAGFLTGANR